MSEDVATGILIPTKLDTPVHRVSISLDPRQTLLDVQEVLGGHTRGVPWKSDPSIMGYTAKDAEFTQSINRGATTLLEGTGNLVEGDFIAGPYLLLGRDVETDAIVSLSDETLSQLCPVELEVRVVIGSAACPSFAAAVGVVNDIMDRVEQKGPFGGTARDGDGNPLATWSFR